MKKLLLTLALIGITSLGIADVYDSTIVITTLEYPTEDRLVPVKTGTQLDPETGKQVDVFEDQLQTFKLIKKGLKLNLPYKVYGQNIVSNGVDITYDLHNPAHEGVEVMAKVDYQAVNNAFHTDDSRAVEGYSGNLGKEFKKIGKDLRYKKHYKKTKADKFATFDKDGVKTPYNGVDANELSKFTEWEGAVKPVVVEDIL